LIEPGLALRREVSSTRSNCDGTPRPHRRTRFRTSQAHSDGEGEANKRAPFASSLPKAAFGSGSTCRRTAVHTIKSKNTSNAVADDSRSIILQCALANRLVLDREIVAQHGQRAWEEGEIEKQAHYFLLHGGVGT